MTEPSAPDEPTTGAPPPDAPPFAEIAAVAAAVLFGFWALPWPLASAGAVLAICAGVVVAVDRRRWLIPDGAVATMALTGLVVALAPAGRDVSLDLLFDPVDRAVVSGLVFWALRAAHRAWRGVEGLGLGDVKLAAAGAVWLPWEALVPALEIAVGGALALTLLGALRERRLPRRDDALPFGVFLAPAVWLTWIAVETGLADRLTRLVAG